MDTQFIARANQMAADAVGKNYKIKALTGDVVEGPIVDCTYVGPQNIGRTIYAMFKVGLLVEYSAPGKKVTLRREYTVKRLPT